MTLTEQQLESCYRTLQEIARDPSVIDDHNGLKTIIAKIHREGKRGQNQRRRGERMQADRDLRGRTAIVRGQQTADDVPLLAESAAAANGEAEAGTFSRPIRCYICKQPYTALHFHYHLLCPECADFNYAKRGQQADLAGRIALITGGRIKIGYEMALRLLRDGARVIVTTRFPRDASERFARETDSSEWRERLSVYRLDLRDVRAVEDFAAHLIRTEMALDIVIHNAAQTVKRPMEFYQELLAKESFGMLDEPVQRLLTSGAAEELSEAQMGTLLPGQYDHYGQPVDVRPENSWSLRLEQIGAVEMLEVQLVNVTAPFVLNSRLKPLFMRSSHARRFIVNVSAMEGQFDRPSKTVFHPHTNMAKAALNMMTRTSAADYARDGIYMNSVDTGWITDENPYPKHRQMRSVQDFYTPLDIIDGMARIYDPIAQGIAKPDPPLYGFFLKDYKPYPW